VAPAARVAIEAAHARRAAGFARRRVQTFRPHGAANASRAAASAAFAQAVRNGGGFEVSEGGIVVHRVTSHEPAQVCEASDGRPRAGHARREVERWARRGCSDLAGTSSRRTWWRRTASRWRGREPEAESAIRGGSRRRTSVLSGCGARRVTWEALSRGSVRRRTLRRAVSIAALRVTGEEQAVENRRGQCSTFLMKPARFTLHEHIPALGWRRRS